MKHKVIQLSLNCFIHIGTVSLFYAFSNVEYRHIVRTFTFREAPDRAVPVPVANRIGARLGTSLRTVLPYLTFSLTGVCNIRENALSYIVIYTGTTCKTYVYKIEVHIWQNGVGYFTFNKAPSSLL